MGSEHAVKWVVMAVRVGVTRDRERNLGIGKKGGNILNGNFSRSSKSSILS